MKIGFYTSGEYGEESIQFYSELEFWTNNEAPINKTMHVLGLNIMSEEVTEDTVLAGVYNREGN